jgi:hypothetical protein
MKKPLREIINRRIIDDLWGAGYTILPRQSDPFNVPEGFAPKDMSYQWEDRQAIGNHDGANMMR